jgi:hypothetical protein
MDRLVFDLGIARNKEVINMNRWKYLFVGECTGDALIALGSPNTSPLDPAEFDKLTDIEEFKHLYITNTAQSGYTLNIYFEEEKLEDAVRIDGDR